MLCFPNLYVYLYVHSKFLYIMDTIKKKPEVTTSIILETRVAKKNNTHPVKLRVTFERKQKYYTIRGHSYSTKDFEIIIGPKQKGKYKDVKRILAYIENSAIEFIDNMSNDFSFEEFEKFFQKKKNNKKTIQDFFEDKIDELNNENKFQSKSLYIATLNSFSHFDSNFSFKKINPNYLTRYENWMISKNENRKSQRFTTIAIYMRNLRHIINRAINKNVFKQSDYPFGIEKDKYQIPVTNNIKKALNLSQIKMLFNSVPDDNNEAKALSYWLFSYLCNGMNMADIANLKYGNIKGNNLIFIRQKTLHTSKRKREISVYLLPEAHNIINNLGNKPQEKNSYIFPVYNDQMSMEQKFIRLKQFIKTTNKYIKRIASKIGLDKEITTYWARHSYSTVLKRSGASIEFISEQLGHTSTKVTTNYLDTFEDDQRAEFAKKLTDF